MTDEAERIYPIDIDHGKGRERVKAASAKEALRALIKAHGDTGWVIRQIETAFGFINEAEYSENGVRHRAVVDLAGTEDVA